LAEQAEAGVVEKARDRVLDGRAPDAGRGRAVGDGNFRVHSFAREMADLGLEKVGLRSQGECDEIYDDLATERFKPGRHIVHPASE
jgi:hypothetical protein